jgi:hypothetical protein
MRRAGAPATVAVKPQEDSMTGKRLFWAIACVLALVAATAVRAGFAPKTYRDATGDVHGAAGPDITSVVVSHDATRITFTVRFSQAPPLGSSASWVDMLLVGVDVPPLGPAPVPRGWKGVDYVFGVHGNEPGVALFKRLGAATRGRLPALVKGASLTVRVPRAKLGNPRWFAFTLAAGREADVEARGSADHAPVTGVFRYVLTA